MFRSTVQKFAVVAMVGEVAALRINNNKDGVVNDDEPSSTLPAQCTTSPEVSMGHLFGAKSSKSSDFDLVAQLNESASSRFHRGRLQTDVNTIRLLANMPAGYMVIRYEFEYDKVPFLGARTYIVGF